MEVVSNQWNVQINLVHVVPVLWVHSELLYPLNGSNEWIRNLHIIADYVCFTINWELNISLIEKTVNYPVYYHEIKNLVLEIIY